MANGLIPGWGLGNELVKISEVACITMEHGGIGLDVGIGLGGGNSMGVIEM